MQKSATQLHDLTPLELDAMIEGKLKNHFDNLKDHLSGKGENVDLLTREQACKLLSINSSTLWTYTNQGKVKAYGIGSRRYYKKSELLEALAPVNN